MRLDKYLKVSRLIKRRTVANEACDAGRVQVNGKVAKAGTVVKAGDVLEIALGSRDPLDCGNRPQGRREGDVPDSAVNRLT